MQDGELAHSLRTLKLNWYKMRNTDGAPDGGGGNPDAGTAEIFIYDEIGGSFGVGVQDFIDELNEIDAPQIIVRINSPGGLLVDAIAISSALQQHSSTIITRVDGIAASAASVVAIAGDRLEMMPGSQLMIHDVMVDISGNAADLKECINWLNEQSMNVASMYANKAQGDVDEWRALMLAETWMFAEESITSGLADALYVRQKPEDAFPPKPDEEPDGDEPEKPDEDEPDEGKNADSEDDNPEDDDEEAQNLAEEHALAVLMHRKHRLTNRGFKYLGRERAPEPALPHNSNNDFTDLLAAWG
jgi:ATP-dependent protease ClpP protease subunit